MLTQPRHQYPASVHAPAFEVGDGVGEGVERVGPGTDADRPRGGQRYQFPQVVVGADGDADHADLLARALGDEQLELNCACRGLLATASRRGRA